MEETSAEVPKKTPIHRRRILIDSKLQLLIIGYFGFTATLPVLITYCTVRISFTNIQLSLGDARYIAMSKFFDLMDKQIEAYTLQTIFLILLINAAFLVGGLFLSHRIAGPIYHLRMHLKKITEERQISKIRFRKADYFKDLQDSVNDFLDKISLK
jgi:methyl-accepting chemotaxis protein